MTPSAACIGEPVSWLRLEQFHLGELQGDERERVAEHVAACGACAACLARIQDDEAHTLPPLAARAPRRVVPFFPAGAMAALGALAAAAMFAVAVGGAGGVAADGRGGIRRASGGVKGDAVAFVLVRDDGERIAGGGGVFRDADRFKAIVTCPPGGHVAFDIVVYDGERAYFPLAAADDLQCGNDVPLPGAFRLTGRSEERVCLVWKDGGSVDRAAVAMDVDADGQESVCKSLVPAPVP